MAFLIVQCQDRTYSSLGAVSLFIHKPLSKNIADGSDLNLPHRVKVKHMLKHLTFVSIYLMWSQMVWFVLSKSTDKQVIPKWGSMTGIYGFHIVTLGFMSLNLKINKKPWKRQKNARHKCQVNYTVLWISMQKHHPWLPLEYSTLSFIFGPEGFFFGQHQSLWLPCCTVSLVFLAAVLDGEVNTRIKWRTKACFLFSSSSTQSWFNIIHSKYPVQISTPNTHLSVPYFQGLSGSENLQRCVLSWQKHIKTIK